MLLDDESITLWKDNVKGKYYLWAANIYNTAPAAIINGISPIIPTIIQVHFNCFLKVGFFRLTKYAMKQAIDIGTVIVEIHSGKTKNNHKNP